MNEQKKTKGAKWFGIPNLVPYMRPYGKLIFWMVLMAFYGSAMDAVIPLFQQYAIDRYIADSTLAGLGWFIGAYVVVILTQTASNYISAFGACKLELSVGRDLKRESFNHLQTLSFSYFNQNSVGYVHARVMSDTDRIASTLAWSMAEGVWHSAYLVCAIVMMLILNWKMALCVLVIVPIVAISSMYFQKKLVFFHRQVREKNSRITGAFNEGITGATTTKTLVVEDKMEKEFDELTADMKKVSVRAMHFRAIFISTTTLAASLALALVLWRGGIVTREGVMLIGTLTVFMNYAQGMMEPIQWLVQALSSLVNVQVNVERFTTLMETKSDVQDTPEVVEKYGDTFSPKKENWEELHGDIEFKDVTFRYPDGDENILEHFNLKVPQGTNVAIVGETGAGKSTLVNLVCRFYEPTEGQVLIDGRDARERSQLWLHSNIGYVLQTPHLFSGTVRENLQWGNPQASDDELLAACRAACVDEFLDRIGGLDGELGQGGAGVSGGQKQRLCIARTLLKHPRVLIFDDSTSAVDMATDAKIREHIARIPDTTVLIIAQRIASVMDADRIVVLDDGRVHGVGTHEELLAGDNIYQEIYASQMEFAGNVDAGDGSDDGCANNPFSSVPSRLPLEGGERHA